MTQNNTSTNADHVGIIKYYQPRSFLSLVAAVILLLGVTAIPVSAQATIYESDFSADTLGVTPSGWLQQYIVAEDPTNSEVKVLATAGGTTRSSYARHPEAAETTDVGGFELALSIYIDEAGANWNTSHYVQKGLLSSATFYSDGYGFNISQTTVNIQRTTGGGSSSDQGSSLVLASSSVSGTWLVDSWNDMVFSWKNNGELSISLNGITLLQTIDTTHEPSYRTLRFNSFINNSTSGGTQGQQLFYKDISVTSIPEYSSMALVSALAALGFCFWRRPGRWSQSG